MIFSSVVRIVVLLFLILGIFLGIIWVLLARPSLTLAKGSNTDAVTIDDKRLFQHVKVLSVDYSPRDYQHPENLKASAAYIKEQFEKIGVKVSEQLYTIGKVEYKNIVASLGPKTEPKLVIGAHYDVNGPNPGADDNASGIAGLIELARLLKNETLKRNITLVAYTLEEPPFFSSDAMGSYVHAKAERENKSKIELMISLEMIGYFSDEKGSQTFPSKLLKLFYPDKGNFILIVDQFFSGWAGKIKTGMAKHMSLPVYSINAPSIIPGIDYSDHRSYWAHGYNAVMVTDTSFYRNFAYHTDKDTLDKLNYKKMAEVVKGVFGTIMELQIN